VRSTTCEHENAPVSAWGIYCHLPFCRRRCRYCDFTTYAGMEGWIPAYVRAMLREIDWMRAASGGPLAVETVYLGGGTPSLLPSQELNRLMVALTRAVCVLPQAEISMEVNPEQAGRDVLDSARASGVNRISLGMQSSDPAILRFLGRRHTHQDTLEAVRRARAAGFQNLGVDLICGIPGQTPSVWAGSVEAALALEPEHISVYPLTVEVGTSLHRMVERGWVDAPDEDATADMLDWLEGRLDRAGFHLYEISNWARGDWQPDGLPRHACRHNAGTWQNRPYLGLGAGAHGSTGSLRYANVDSIPAYLRRLSGATRSGRFPLSPAVSGWRQVDDDESARETAWLGLRLTEKGLCREAFVARHGPRAWRQVTPTLEALSLEGLLEWIDPGERVRLTRRGRRLANRVFRELV
jgi:oxygen-independent coproporphyrinogen-3 oxidase